MNLSRHNAFTLIEALVVVALLGILLGVALPWWLHQHDSEQEAKVAALGGHFAHAVIQVKTHWIAIGSPGAVSALERYPIKGVATSSKGWPTDVVNSMKIDIATTTVTPSNSAQLDADAERCLRLWQGLLVQAPLASTLVLPERAFLVEAVNETVCRYSYIHHDRHSRIEYNLSTGLVVTVL